jgi:hypothetical protein
MSIKMMTSAAVLAALAALADNHIGGNVYTPDVEPASDRQWHRQLQLDDEYLAGTVRGDAQSQRKLTVIRHRV